MLPTKTQLELTTKEGKSFLAMKDNSTGNNWTVIRMVQECGTRVEWVTEDHFLQTFGGGSVKAFGKRSMSVFPTEFMK